MGNSSIVSSITKKGVSVAVKDKNDETTIRIAMRNNKKEVIRIILCSNKWEQALQTGKEAETMKSATYSLIRNFPALFEIAMDKCCTMDFEKNELLFNVKYIEDYQTDENIKPKTADMALHNPIYQLVQIEKEKLFTHPLTLIHLNHEWENFGEPHYTIFSLLSLNISIFYPLFFYLVSSGTKFYYNHCAMNKLPTPEPNVTNSTQMYPDIDDSTYGIPGTLGGCLLLVLFMPRILYFFFFHQLGQILSLRHRFDGRTIKDLLSIAIELLIWITAIVVLFLLDTNGPKTCIAWQIGVLLIPLLCFNL